MSDPEFEAIKRKCSDRLNWSDGGHWIGIGREPDCFQSREKRSSSEVTYVFADPEGARKFNLLQEELASQRAVSMFGVGAIFTVAAQVLSLGWAGVIGGIGIGVVSLLPQKFPPVQAGDKITIVIKSTSTASVHPWGKNVTSVQYTITHFQGGKPSKIVNLKQDITQADLNGKELNEAIFKYMKEKSEKVTYTFTGDTVKVTK